MNKLDSSQIISGKFDYTKWQREYFDDKVPEEISEEACQFEKLVLPEAVWQDSGNNDITLYG